MTIAMAKKFLFKKVQFITSACDEKGYPHHQLPEIALAGRSNVGKSSLLNHLLRHKIAKTSASPGKTQLLNFFCVDDQLMLVDLPGYGYAKVPPKVKAKWGPMIQKYLTDSQNLQLCLLLFDIRRIPNQDDLALVEWMQYYQKKILLVLTKVDKVKRNELHNNTKKIIDTLAIPNIDYVHYSVKNNIGRDQLITTTNKLMLSNEQ